MSCECAHTFFQQKKLTSMLLLGDMEGFVDVVKFLRRFPNLCTVFSLDAQTQFASKKEHGECERKK